MILYCNRDFWLHRDSTSFCADGLWIADPSAPEGQPAGRAPLALPPVQLGRRPGPQRRRTSPAGPPCGPGRGKGAARQPRYEPFPGAGWFTTGRRSPIVAAMHARLVAVGCNHYRSTANKDVIGSGDVASYEAWQRKYNTDAPQGLDRLGPELAARPGDLGRAARPERVTRPFSAVVHARAAEKPVSKEPIEAPLAEAADAGAHGFVAFQGDRDGLGGGADGIDEHSGGGALDGTVNRVPDTLRVRVRQAEGRAAEPTPG